MARTELLGGHVIHASTNYGALCGTKRAKSIVWAKEFMALDDVYKCKKCESVLQRKLNK